MPKGIHIFRHLPWIANNQKENWVKIHEPAFHKRGNTMANKYVKKKKSNDWKNSNEETDDIPLYTYSVGEPLKVL